MGQIVSFDGYKPAARFDGVPWTEAQISEAPGSTGPWAVIDTVSLGTPDPDPGNPQPRSFTTHNGTGPDLWYRVVFLDGAGGQSVPTAAVQNAEAATIRFASSDELAERLGLTFTAAEAARVGVLLALASGMIQQETKQTIALVSDDAYTRPGDYDTKIRLPQRPVVAVSSVVLNGVTLEPDVNYYVDKDELVRLNWNAVIQDSSFGLPWAGWGFPWWQLDIVYSHGYGTIPEIVKAVCMEMVTRVWVNPGSVARETVGDSATVYDNVRFSPTGLLMTDTEKTELNKLLRRHSGSYALR